MRASPVLSLLLVGCGSPAIVAGNIGDVAFEKAHTAWFGGPLIVIADEAMPCDQMGWVSRSYVDGVSADGRRDFAAIQIAFPSTVEEGPFLAERAQGLTVLGLVNTRDDLEILHAREGDVVIESTSTSSVRGFFSIAFADSGVAGEFEAKPCVNLQ